MAENRHKVFQTRTSKVWLGEDGIVRLISLPVKAISLADAENNWAAVAEAGQGVARPILGDIREVRGISREARKFYASDDTARIVSAIALQVDSPISRMIGNLFLGFNKPPAPVRLFGNNDEAIAWLKGFLQLGTQMMRKND